MSFQLYTKNFFVTYPRCDLPHGTIHEFFTSISPEPSYVITAAELHQDGSTHYHACVCFPTRKRLRDSRVWDIESHHPNIQAARNVGEVLSYVRKGGDFRESGVAPRTKRGWKEVLDESNNTVQFMEGVKEISPRDYVLQYDRIDGFCRKHFARLEPYVSPYELESFVIPDELTGWALNSGLATGPAISVSKKKRQKKREPKTKRQKIGRNLVVRGGPSPLPAAVLLLLEPLTKIFMKALFLSALFVVLG